MATRKFPYFIEMDNPPKLPTLEEIKGSIPKHCFQRSLFRSLYYMAEDFVCLYGLYLVLPFVERQFGFLGLFIWYWIAGLHMFAIFVVGHDCGHGSFSDYKWVNDLFGHIAHGFLLIPYWPWKKSHRFHHTFTQKLGHDRAFPWITEEKYATLPLWTKLLLNTSIFSFIRYNVFYLLLGMPDGSHVWPWSRFFQTTRERVECVISNVVWLLFGYLIFTCLCESDFFVFFKYYLVPIMFHNFWLIMITYLQHRDEHSEVYEPGTWTFVRGQLQTIDIEYGLGIDSIVHHVSSDHVVHHLFSRIPHYNLEEATLGIRRALQKYPGAYKRTERYKYWFIFKYQWMLLKLDSLVGKGTGVLNFRRFVKKTET